MNATVLVVDDEERIQVIAPRNPRRTEGFRVLDTGDPAGVMDLIARENPALVLLDIWMPNIDGIELAPPRSRPSGRRSRVIMISGPRQHPERGRGDAARRRRLHRKTVLCQPALLTSIERVLPSASRAACECPAAPRLTPLRRGPRQLREPPGASSARSRARW